jgi:hypothetical protein
MTYKPQGELVVERRRLEESVDALVVTWPVKAGNHGRVRRNTRAYEVWGPSDSHRVRPTRTTTPIRCRSRASDRSGDNSGVRRQWPVGARF